MKASNKKRIIELVQEINEMSDWKLVPVEPTEEMHNAAREWSRAKYGQPIGLDASKGCWNVMLKAAPQPPDDELEMMNKHTTSVTARQNATLRKALLATSPLLDDELARFEREIAENYFGECMYDFSDGNMDKWFEMPEHHYESGGLIWYGLERGLLERNPDNPNFVRSKEQDDGQ